MFASFFNVFFQRFFFDLLTDFQHLFGFFLVSAEKVRHREFTAPGDEIEGPGVRRHDRNKYRTSHQNDPQNDYNLVKKKQDQFLLDVCQVF